MAKCTRCTNEIETGDEFATEELSPTNYRFFHWLCVKKDKTFLGRIIKSPTTYIRYNVAKPEKS